MSEINYIFTHVSIQEIIILIIALILAIKVVGTAIEWIWGKIKTKFDIENEQQTWENKVSEQLENLDSKIDNLELQNKQTHDEQNKINTTLALVQERLQENTRSYLIDAHHKFCYQIKAIDDMNLQSIERRYLYYKTAGGNSFVDNLMDEIRALPRMNIYMTKKENNSDGRLST